MRSRVVRVGVVVLLLAAGTGAAYVAWDADRQLSRTKASDVESSLDRLLFTVSDLNDTLTAYVAPGRDASRALERFPDVLRQLSGRTAEAGALTATAEGQQGLRAVADATARLTQADASARDSLLLGDTFTASHVVFGEARASLDAMMSSIRTVRQAERAHAVAQAVEISGRTRLVVGGVALLWLAGLLVLVPLPRPQVVESTLAAETPRLEVAPVVPLAPPEPEPAPAVDLTAAAELCTSIARVEDTAELTSLLERAAALLSASELVVWMRGGDQLFAALVPGAREDGKVRLPLERDDDSPAVAAWQSGTVHVTSAEDAADGVDVIAAPLVGPGGCSGVVTVALSPPAQADAATTAVVVMIAAQLSTVVSARPPAPASAVAAS